MRQVEGITLPGGSIYDVPIKVNPWPNGLASRRKFWPPTCVDLNRLATTCLDLRGLWSSANVDASTHASFLPFGHPAQVDTS